MGGTLAHHCVHFSIFNEFFLSLWYFREDIGVNLHHWHWHLVYPFEAFSNLIVAKDRRGEMFYYMHEQVFIQFDFDSFSVI